MKKTKTQGDFADITKNLEQKVGSVQKRVAGLEKKLHSKEPEPEKQVELSDNDIYRVLMLNLAGTFFVGAVMLLAGIAGFWFRLVLAVPLLWSGYKVMSIAQAGIKKSETE